MKFYFLCEGARDKSEYVFISAVISEFRKNEEFVLIPANGKENIERVFLDLKANFNNGDIFILQ